MAIFLVIAQPNPNNSKLPAAIERAFPESYLKIADNAWLVSGAGPAKAVSDKLGISPDGASGGAIVSEVTDYYGRASTNIWAWIKAKFGSSKSG